MPASTATVAVVAGASSGVGRETALLLARSDFRVFATMRSDAGDRALQARIRLRESLAAGMVSVIPHDAMEWLMNRVTGGRAASRA